MFVQQDKIICILLNLIHVIILYSKQIQAMSTISLFLHGILVQAQVHEQPESTSHQKHLQGHTSVWMKTASLGLI